MLQDAIDVENILMQTKNRSSAVLKNQPIPVVIGPLAKPTKSYVVIDNKTYEVESVLHAIDKSLKICWAVDCEYPTNSGSLWIFLQKAYFNIDNKEKISNKANSFIGEVQAIISEI